jgi:hypothetical protein
MMNATAGIHRGARERGGTSLHHGTGGRRFDRRQCGFDSGNDQDRGGSIDDRPVQPERQGDDGGRTALHAGARRHDRGQEDRNCPQGRRQRTDGKRLAQELIVNDKVALLLGGITPSKIVTLINDWAPGIEAEETFRDFAVRRGAEKVGSLRVPLANPDFAPFLQRARDLKPDTLFALVPNTQAAPLVKQFLERGMDKSGIRLVATGDLTPDDDLPNMTDASLFG